MSLILPTQIDVFAYFSLAFLFGIAAQFRAMDGFSLLRRVIAIFERKIGILYAIVVVTSLLSPFILNDVVVIVLTPVVIRYAKQFRVDVAPLVIAEIVFSNIASSLTPFGNPQNILLWNASKVTFAGFVAGSWLPLVISGAIAILTLYPFRKRLGGQREFPTSTSGSRLPAIYLVMVTLIIVLFDLFGFAPYLSLGMAFLLGFLFTFGSLRRLVKEFDLKSLLILYGFVGSVTLVSILIGSFFVQYLTPVAEGEQPYSALFVGLLSNLISNVPATQLILSVTSIPANITPKIAVQAGLAGNIDPIASFANLLVLLMVRRAGFSIKRIALLQFAIGLVSFLPAFF